MPKDFCSDHKCVKDKIDNLRDSSKVWHRIRDSKWFFWSVTGFIAGFFAFNIWVVTEIYAQKANEKENKKVADIICVDVKEIKQDVKDSVGNLKKELESSVKEIKKEMKEDNEKREIQRQEDQRELMRILLKIQEKIKK